MTRCLSCPPLDDYVGPPSHSCASQKETKKKKEKKEERKEKKKGKNRFLSPDQDIPGVCEFYNPLGFPSQLPSLKPRPEFECDVIRSMRGVRTGWPEPDLGTDLSHVSL